MSIRTPILGALVLSVAAAAPLHATNQFFPPAVDGNSKPFEKVFRTSGIMAQLTRPVEKRRCDEPCGFLSDDSNELTRAQFNIIIEGLATEFSPELAAMGWRVEGPPRRIVLGSGQLGSQTTSREPPLLQWRPEKFRAAGPCRPSPQATGLRLDPSPIPKP